MKKFVLLMVSIVVFVFVSFSVYHFINQKKTGENREIRFSEGKLQDEDKYWEQSEYDEYSDWASSAFPLDNYLKTFAGKPIKTKDKAIEIGNVILESAKKDDLFLSTDALMSVFHDTKDNVWIFEYAEDRKLPPNVILSQHSFYVAVIGETSELHQMWVD